MREPTHDPSDWAAAREKYKATIEAARTASDAAVEAAREVARNNPHPRVKTISGRFSARYGSEQAGGQFRYEPNPWGSTLDLFSPTGTQVARIDATLRGATATLANGERRVALSRSELLRQFIDIPISDEEFSSWLLGVPLNPSTVPTYGNDGKIESFSESGWTIVVSGRFDGGAGFVRRMRWTFDAGGDSARDAQVTWVFDEFSTP
jgi:outer membrane biogenesis lipoprotein LolB